MKASPFETLQKILRLEREQGYLNRAVIGGLSDYAGVWERQTRPAARRPEQGTQITKIAATLRGYDALPTAEREARVHAALQILHRAPPPSRAAHEGTPARQGERPQRRSREPRSPPAVPSQPPAPKLEQPPRQRRPSLDATDAILAWQALEQPVTLVTGIGVNLEKVLAKRGVRSIRDLLFDLRPRRFEDYRQLRPLNALVAEQATTVIGTVRETWQQTGRNNRRDFCLMLEDSAGSLRVIFFGQPYLERQIQPGMRLSLSGTPRFFRDRLQLTNPEWQSLEEADLRAGRIVPIYPQMEGWPQKTLRRTMEGALNEWAARVPEPLPLALRDRCELADIDWALRQAHFPESDEHRQHAERRLAFDALLVWQLALLARRREWQALPGPALAIDETSAADLPSLLFDFALTAAQERAYAEIHADMMRARPMIRLLQGDVGSGKTAVAALAMVLATCGGAQAALMAPTSILAEQHFRNFSETCARLPEPPRIALATSALSAKGRKELREGLAAGTVDLVIGTQALIQEGVEFQDLALVVTDEEQRFGVEQRKQMRGKGQNPHLLVMSATLMPRTLAVTLSPDMDLSVLDELPHGQRAIDTRLYSPRVRAEAYRQLSLELDRGGQAFVVNPLVDEGVSGGLDVSRRYEWLRRNFPDKRVGLLHGQLTTGEKDAAMRSFAAGETDVLATTSIAEVGIDIPNASVMLIEGANRFGLAQLHQLRGRVGRSGQRAYCLLVAENEDEAHNKRLRVMTETDDGFALANLDLKQRWEGTVPGMRVVDQLGLEHMLSHSSELLEFSQREARRIFEEDTDLQQESHALLAQLTKAIWQKPKRAAEGIR